MARDTLYPLRQVQVRLKVMEGEPLYSASPVNSPQKAAALVTKMLGEMDREYVCLASLDSRAVPLSYHIVTIGGLDICPAPVPNIFKAAILENAASIILFHNHPSGDPSPSIEDRILTEKVAEAGNLMGIPVLDHVIVGSGTGDLYSFREHMPELFAPKAASWYKDRPVVSESRSSTSAKKRSILKALKDSTGHVQSCPNPKRSADLPER
jgi:hypothetical protein